MPENGTVSRCAFWIRQQPLRVTAPMVIVKNSNHTPKYVSVAQDSVHPSGQVSGLDRGFLPRLSADKCPSRRKSNSRCIRLYAEGRRTGG